MPGIHWKEAGKHYLPINRNGTIHDLWSAAKIYRFLQYPDTGAEYCNRLQLSFKYLKWHRQPTKYIPDP